MSEAYVQEEDVKYNQRVISSETSKATSSENGTRTTTGESGSNSSQRSNSSRSQDDTENGTRTSAAEGSSRDVTDSNTATDRTSETVRALNGKSVQNAKSNEKANIAFQISFTVPIRTVTPTLPDSGACA